MRRVISQQRRCLFGSTRALLEQDHYKVLNIPRNSTSQDIKSAYRALAKKYHPDMSGKGNADMFSRVNDAYQQLSDPQKRQVYDMSSAGMGSAGGMGAGGSAAGAGHNYNTAQQGFQGWNDMEFNYAGTHSQKMGADLGRMWEEIFNDGKGAGSAPHAARYQPVRGGDVSIKVKLGFLEAVEGCQKEVSYYYQRKCVPCKGTGSRGGEAVSKCSACHGRGKSTKTNGYYHVEQPCTVCGGAGEIIRALCSTCGGKGTAKERTTQLVTMPAGVNSKDRLRVNGKGDAGIRGGAPGNLFVDLIVDNDTVFTRDKEDIHLIQPVTVSDAMLGAKISVATISGDVALTVPPSTQQGDKIVLKGKGVRKPNQNQVGDMYVHFHVLIPKSLTQKQRLALEHFAEDEDRSSSLDLQTMMRVKSKYQNLITFKGDI
ncbi:Chaperone protein DnaJ [Diplonema papillatum]|nr:Chaperone protein DnaJ [Diplonema papillatum]